MGRLQRSTKLRSAHLGQGEFNVHWFRGLVFIIRRRERMDGWMVQVSKSMKVLRKLPQHSANTLGCHSTSPFCNVNYASCNTHTSTGALLHNVTGTGTSNVCVNELEHVPGTTNLFTWSNVSTSMTVLQRNTILIIRCYSHLTKKKKILLSYTGYYQ